MRIATAFVVFIPVVFGPGPVGAPFTVDRQGSWRSYRPATCIGTNDGYLSVFTTSLGGPIKARRIAGLDDPLPDPVLVAPYSSMISWAAAAWNPGAGKALVTFVSQDPSDSQLKLYGRLLTAAGATVGAAFLIGPFSPNQYTGTEPSVASDGIDWIVTWTSYLEGPAPHVRGRVVKGTSGSTGPVFGGNSVQVSNGGSQGELGGSATCTPGGRYLVAWFDLSANRIAGRTLSGDAASMGTIEGYTPDGFETSTAFIPCVTGGPGGTFMVAGSANGLPWARWLAPDGSTVGIPSALAIPVSNLYVDDSMTAAWNPVAGYFAISWLEMNYDDGSSTHRVLIREATQTGIDAGDWTLGAWPEIPPDFTLSVASSPGRSELLFQWIEREGHDSIVKASRFDLVDSYRAPPSTPGDAASTDEGGSDSAKKPALCGAAGGSASLLAALPLLLLLHRR